MVACVLRLRFDEPEPKTGAGAPSGCRGLCRPAAQNGFFSFSSPSLEATAATSDPRAAVTIVQPMACRIVTSLASSAGTAATSSAAAGGVT